jgi:hypothetical protein
MLTEGSKAIYCLGEKEEIVDIIRVQPDFITIYVSSLHDEIDVLHSELKPLSESNEFRLELPEKEPLLIDITTNQHINEITCDLYKEVANLESRDKVLIENQKNLFEQVKSLKKIVNDLKRKDEENVNEIREILRLMKEQQMVYELELKELRKLLKQHETKET